MITFSVIFVIPVYYVSSIYLDVKPAYIRQGETLHITCNDLIIMDSSYNTTFFSGNYGLIAQIYYNNFSECFHNNGNCEESRICSCNSTAVQFNYSPASSRNDSFYCEHDRKSNTVFVRALDRPRNLRISPSTPSYVRPVGSSLSSISCSADCEPTCTFEWTFPDGTTGSSNILSLSRIEKGHNGTFTCKVENSVGSEEIGFSLDVQYAPENTTLSPPKTSYDVKENDALEITCSADCNPECSFRWTGPNSWTFNGPILRFTSIAKSNDGSYVCRVSNSRGIHYSPYVRISVDYKPSNIRISPTTTTYTNTSVGGELGPITCSADCKPSCQFTWTYPNNAVNSGGLLHISSLSADDHHGNFQCKASNSLGSLMLSISVTVNYPPDTIQLSPSNSVQTVIEFKTASVTCSATCRPECSYSWRRRSNGVIVSSSSQLYLSSVSRSNAGDYFCRATNDYGSTDSPYVSIIVHTLPTTVNKISVICTGPESASISWIPDLTVVPEQNFTISYWPSLNGQSQRMTKMYVKDTSHQYIYIMYLDGLAASTGYSFQILADNGIGKRWSNVRTCSTFRQLPVDSAASAEVIGGITMMTIAALIIITIVILFVLRRYGFNVLNACGKDLSCWKRKTEAPENPYVNVQGQRQDEGEGENDEDPYQDLQRSKSKKEETKPYDTLQVTSSGLQGKENIDLEELHVQEKVNKENKLPVNQGVLQGEILSAAQKVAEKKNNPYANVDVAKMKKDQKGQKHFNFHKQPIKPPITKPKPKREN